MTKPRDPRSIESVNIAPLQTIVEGNQVWSRMAAQYGVDNPVPPWKSSLDGMCDALDQSACAASILGFAQRRSEEDQLSATIYADLPYPENQLVSLAHSLVVAGVIDEAELQERIASIRARLES
jgi:Nitrile hydratase beta subunit